MSRQKGAAIVTAMFFMTLAAVLAVAMLFRQSVDIKRTELVVNIDKMLESANYATVWAKARLTQHIKESGDKRHDDLTQRWAVPMPVTTLNGIKVSAKIIDASRYFNINNLIIKTQKKEKKTAPTYESDQMFARFLMLVQGPRPPTLEEIGFITKRLLKWLNRKGAELGGSYIDLQPPIYAYSIANMPMSSISELRLVEGITPAMMQSLSKWLFAIPVSTFDINTKKVSKGIVKVNVNTTSKEVLAAMSAISLDQAESVLSNRPFENMKAFRQAIRSVLPKPRTRGKDDSKGPPEFNFGDWFSVKSNYFLLETTVRQDKKSLVIYKLLRVGKDQHVSILWQSIGTV